MHMKTYIIAIGVSLALISVGAWGLIRGPQPVSKIILPVRWGNLGTQLIASGVLDREKLDALSASRGGLSEDERALIETPDTEYLVITRQNANFLLNLLWALGLGNENPILTQGPMQDPRYGGAGGFASTGGWTLARGNAMAHYAAHRFITLTPEQQALVEGVAKHIYRPCCDNPTHFPDCNHGMAMLGLLELMASQGATGGEMYRTALAVNSYWFPDTYLTIAQYLASQDTDWEDADPKTILGPEYSSASGYRTILEKVRPSGQGNNSCSV